MPDKGTYVSVDLYKWAADERARLKKLWDDGKISRRYYQSSLTKISKRLMHHIV